MGPDFVSETCEETCFTCSKKSMHFHKISDSVGDTNPNIRHIICQHFWFEEDDLRSAIVCESCWEKVHQFHQFYLDVKKLHEHGGVAPLLMFIKQEEITIEETKLQGNCINILAENRKLFDKADCKLENTAEFDELPKKEEPAEDFPKPRKNRKYARLLSNQRVVKRKYPNPRKLPISEERDVQDDFIKQHTRYICDECNIEFENFRTIKYHRINAHKKLVFVCCGTKHRTRTTLYQHVQSLLNPDAFKCELCGKSYKSKYKYVRHKELFHAAEEDLVFKCNRCPKSFIKESFLKIHLAEHETLENETAKCEFCGKCFRNQSILNKHVRVAHKKQMDYTCEVCSKGFYLRGMFLEHQKTHELTAEQIKEQCLVCFKWFKRHSSLLQHMKYMHVPENQRKKQCSVCNKWLKNHSNWRQHVRLHKETECKCEVCGKVSASMKSLKLHMKYKHGPDRMRHVCELCGKDYSRAIILKEHVACAHTKEHLYQCQYCEQKFFSYGTMYAHRKKDHPQEWLEDHVLKNTRREEVSDGDKTVC